MISEGTENSFQIDRDISVGEILLIIFVFPLATIYANFVTTKPWGCFKGFISKTLDYQPFKKKK